MNVIFFFCFYWDKINILLVRLAISNMSRNTAILCWRKTGKGREVTGILRSKLENRNKVMKMREKLEICGESEKYTSWTAIVRKNELNKSRCEANPYIAVVKKVVRNSIKYCHNLLYEKTICGKKMRAQKMNIASQ